MEELIAAEQEYKDAAAKLEQFKTDRDEIQREINEIDGKIRTVQNRREDPVKAAAELLLTGEYNNPEDVNPLFTNRDDLAIKRRVILSAIPMQEKIVGGARSRYARFLGQSRHSEYAGILRETVKAVIALSHITEKERVFRDSFDKAGLSFYIAFGNPLNFSKIGSLSDYWSRASMYLDEVVKAGYLTAAEVEELKQEAGRQGEDGRGKWAPPYGHPKCLGCIDS